MGDVTEYPVDQYPHIRVSEEDWVVLWNALAPEDREMIRRDEWVTLILRSKSGKPLMICIDQQRCFQTAWYKKQKEVARV